MNEKEKKNKKMGRKITIQKIGRDDTRGRRTKKGSTRYKRSERRSTGDKKTKKRSAEGKKTKIGITGVGISREGAP